MQNLFPPPAHGAPTAMRLTLTLSPTLLTFIDEFVIPYLFGHSYFARHGVMPFGELDHGGGGIHQYLADLFRAPSRPGTEDFVLLASMKKRQANKRPCPCGSGTRLGRCHHRRVNQLRSQLGRRWFQDEHARIQRHLSYLSSLAQRPKMSENAAEIARNRRKLWGPRKDVKAVKE